MKGKKKKHLAPRCSLCRMRVELTHVGRHERSVWHSRFKDLKPLVLAGKSSVEIGKIIGITRACVVTCLKESGMRPAWRIARVADRKKNPPKRKPVKHGTRRKREAAKLRKAKKHAARTSAKKPQPKRARRASPARRRSDRKAHPAQVVIPGVEPIHKDEVAAENPAA